MSLKAFFRAATLGLTLTACSCHADRVPPTPVSPSPVVPPLNTSVRDLYPPGELWRLTTTIVGLEGGVCFWSWPVGKTFDWTLSVDRNAAQVRFVYDVNNPHDNLLFVGAVNDRSFTAASNTYHSSWMCSGGVTLSSSVLGSFSADGRMLSGRERLTYRQDDERAALTITLEWTAARIEER